MKMNSKSESKLNEAPADVISSIEFGINANNFLFVTSWDKTVRFYDTDNNIVRKIHNTPSPILDGCFQVYIIYMQK